MKKSIFLIVFILLFTTGCTCEYNLTINDNNYREEVKIIASNSEEIALLNNDWSVSIDKEENDQPGDEGSSQIENTNQYNYSLSNNNLTFTYDFSRNKYEKSTAVSNCYNQLTVTDYLDDIIISTSNNAICFDKYPNLDSVTINITVDKEVKKNNADIINGNKYTWLLTKANHDKGINLILDNSINKSNNNPTSNTIIEKEKKDYSLYIFYGILLLIVLISYLIYNYFKKNKDNKNDI